MDIHAPGSASLTTARHALCLTFALAALIAAAAAPALAQTVVVPEIVITANQTPTEAPKVGSAVSVIPGEALRGQGFTTVADALRTLPGLSVSQAGNRGGLTQVRIRGAEANHTLVMIDGVPVNDFANGDFNFANFAIEDVERIEVVRGPQSGIYGANAHAGVISIITKTGRGLASPQANVRLEGGSMNTGTAAGTFRGAMGPFYYAVSAENMQSSGYNVARNGSELDGSRALTTTAKAGVDFTPDVNVEGTLRRTRRYTEFDAQPFFGPLEGIAEDSPLDFNRFTGTNQRVAATWRLFDGRFVQRIAASRYDERRFDDDHVFGFFRSRGHRDNFDYKATLTADTQFFGGERHTLTGVIDRQVEFLTIDSASLGFDPVAAAFWAAGAQRTRDGLAGEYSIDLPVGLTATGAIRHDKNSGFGDLTTWRATLNQRFAETGTRVHASIGTGATNPTFIEQFGFFLGSFIGNPDLKPEQSLGWDGGIEQSLFGGRFVADVTLFASNFEDKITLVTAGGGFISTPINVQGISPRRGVEVTTRLTPVEWLVLTGTYTYTDARLADGTPEVRRPRHAASGSATVNFADGRGRATARFVYNGTMADQWFRFPITPVTLEAYTVVGGIVEFDVMPQLTVFVRGENIFDAHYEEVFSYVAPGAAVYAGFKGRLGG
jgi:vitamin B12 transporter